MQQPNLQINLWYNHSVRHNRTFLKKLKIAVANDEWKLKKKKKIRIIEKGMFLTSQRKKLVV